MKIDLFNVEEFIEINHLQEVTSPILFQRGDVPHPNGLISNEIFGVTTKSRKETFAYIDLHGHFFHPHVYKAIKRMFANIEKIVSGDEYYNINEFGYLVKDDINGDTGIEFLYNNWDKIKWEEKESRSRAERIGLLSNLTRDEVFMTKQIVIPAFYRDIKTGSSSGGGTTDDINNLYAKLIRLSHMVQNRDMFDFQFHNTNYNIQSIIINIYDYFKHKLEKKRGLIRKYLMGKNCDYCTRTVITAPSFHSDRPEDLYTNLRYTSIPISQVCSLAYPFVVYYIKNFFEREIFDNNVSKIVYNPVTDKIDDSLRLYEPENHFTDKYIKKMIDTFIKDPESRFNKIEVPVIDSKDRVKTLYLSFSGTRMDSSSTSELSDIVNRPMTWTDLLYMACEDVTKDKHCLITRYPLNDEFGVFISRIRVASTVRTKPMMVNGRVYKWYPDIQLGMPLAKIGIEFIDSCQFSNSYLPGIEGDYDGDQTTVKIIFTQEANEECETVMNRKSFFINSAGNNIRKIGKEALQTFYVLTKPPKETDRTLSDKDKEFFVKMNPKDITFHNLVKWFGNTVDIRDDNKNKKTSTSMYNPTDKLTISEKDYPELLKDGEILETTLGKLIFNKILVEGLGFGKFIGYQNQTMFAKVYGKFDATVAEALKNDIITVADMYNYVDTRDWFGLQVHGVITTSFTEGVLRLPPEIKKLKKDLYEEHKEAIANGDERVMNIIEQKLLSETKKALKDDIGMDLYNSGARGSVDNHLKNIMLTRGAVKNTVTGKYDIIYHSLMDGLEKKDIPAHSNMILAGAYPKSVGTQVSGYLGKEISSALQSEVLGDKDSDCGSKGYLVIKLTNLNKKDFLYRYIIEGNKLIYLDEETIEKYIGKEVKMRSPMFCIGVGKEKCLCNKCAGDFYYKLEKKNVGLSASRVASTCTQMNLQKFHENLVKIMPLNVDSLLV